MSNQLIGAIFACFYVARVWQRQLGFLVSVARRIYNILLAVAVVLYIAAMTFPRETNNYTTAIRNILFAIWYCLTYVIVVWTPEVFQTPRDVNMSSAIRVRNWSVISIALLPQDERINLFKSCWRKELLIARSSNSPPPPIHQRLCDFMSTLFWLW